MNMDVCYSTVSRLEAGIVREIEERKETHTVMFAGLQEKLKVAVATVEAEAEASITARFEPGLSEHVSRCVCLCVCSFLCVFVSTAPVHLPRTGRAIRFCIMPPLLHQRKASR